MSDHHREVRSFSKRADAAEKDTTNIEKGLEAAFSWCVLLDQVAEPRSVASDQF